LIREEVGVCDNGLKISAMTFRTSAQKILGLADIRIDGDRSWDIHTHNEKFFQRLFIQGSLGLGESYMEGWWDAERLDEFFHKVIKAGLSKRVNQLKLIVPYIKASLLNLQSRSRVFQVGKAHYDLGNDFFQHMLDKRLVYTCALWKDAKSLDEAQEAKLDMVCRKIGLKSGDNVLDIGCGWGSFAKFAAEEYGAQVVGITISRQQVEFARDNCKNLPVEIRLQDYRNVHQTFDHIVSLGMFEHVGQKNHRTYLQVVHRCLKEGGLFLLQTIGDRVTNPITDPWIANYIFPNGDIPSLRQIAKAAEKYFIIEDLHNFGSDYDRTLMAWFDNFNQAWPKFKTRYSERFYRMWKYYLLSCAGAFRARDLQLWQIVLSAEGVPGGYQRVVS
jgi:cyclopropane-fatty-acyl-phospholipid synthase